MIELQRVADATENQRQIESIREESETVESEFPVDLVNILESGVLLADHGKMAEAEKMYERALEGYEKAWGPEHISTLDTINNLGNLYPDQGKMAEAEKMYERALEGYEKAWGPEHISTLDTVNKLGIFYRNQGKLNDLTVPRLGRSY